MAAKGDVLKELLHRLSASTEQPQNSRRAELANRVHASSPTAVYHAAEGRPLAAIPNVPDSPDVITRDMLEEIVRWKMEDITGQPVNEFEASEPIHFAADWNPALHPRGPDGKFIERPWNIDLAPGDINDTSTHDLVEFLGDTQGEPDMDSILSDDSIRIDGIPDDVNSVEELKRRKQSPEIDEDVGVNPRELTELDGGEVIRTPDGPATVEDTNIQENSILVRRPGDGGLDDVQLTDLSRNTVDEYDVNSIEELPSQSSESGETGGLDNLPQTTISPEELESNDYFISKDGTVLEFKKWWGETPDDPESSDALVHPISGTSPLEAEFPDNLQRIDVDDKERVLAAMTMDNVATFEQEPSILKRGSVFKLPDADPDDPENWYEVKRMTQSGGTIRLTAKKNTETRGTKIFESDDLPDRITRAFLSTNEGLDDLPANVRERRDEFEANSDLPGIEVPDQTAYLVNTKAAEKGVDISEYEGQPRELAKALVAATSLDTMTKGAWSDTQPVLRDRIDQMKDDRLALQFAAHLNELKKKSGPGGSVSRLGNPENTTGQDTSFKLGGSNASTSLAAHEAEHAIIDGSGAPASVNTAKAQQYNSGQEFSFSRELQGDTLDNMSEYFFTGRGMFGEASGDELEKPASEALQFEEWSDTVEKQIRGLSEVVDFRGRKQFDDPADYWRNIEEGDAIEFNEFSFDDPTRAVVTDIEREANEANQHRLTVRLRHGDDDTYKRGERELWLSTRGEIDPTESDIRGATSTAVNKIKKGAVSDEDLNAVEFGDAYAAEQLRQDFPDDDVDRLYEYIDAVNQAFYRQAVAKDSMGERDWEAYAISSPYSATNAHETAAVMAGQIQSATKDSTTLARTLATRHPRLLAAYAAQYDLPTGFANALRSVGFDFMNADGDRDGTEELGEAIVDLADTHEVTE